MSCVFIDNSSIHKSFGIPLKFDHFFEQISSIILSWLQQTIYAFFDYQQTSIIGFSIRILIKIDNLALISIFREQSSSLLYLVSRIAMLCRFSDDLHSFVILCLISESYCHGTHISLLKNINYRSKNVVS